MKKYVQDRSRQMKNRIIVKANEELGDFEKQIFWESGSWWIKVIISKDDVIEYNVVDEDGKIDFEVR
jgi:hypothetical protein